LGKATGFLEIERRDRSYAPVDKRLKNWNEFIVPLAPETIRDHS